MGIYKGVKMKIAIILLIIFALFMPASAETIIYDNITIGQYKSIKINDITNLKYVNEYKYDIYLNDSFYGTFSKGEVILVPDNVFLRIVPATEIKTSLNANSFTSIIGAGFYSFMQYGVYIIIAFFIIMWILKRRRK